MSLTTSLARRNHVYRALVMEAPLLASPDLPGLLGYDKMSKVADLTTVKLTTPEAALAGTAFDYLQRFLVGEKWRREPRWDPRHVARYPLLTLLYPHALASEDLEAAAITMALLDQISRVGAGKVAKSGAHGALVRAKTVDQFVSLLSPRVLQALRELRTLNADIIEGYKARTPLIPGPHMFASPFVHGADPDAIYGSSLVELKTHKRLSSATITAALTQGFAYAMLDTLDEYRLDSVEVWEAKQHWVLTVPLSLLVPDLAGARRRLALKLRWTQHARDDEHAEDLILRGQAQAAAAQAARASDG